MEAIVWRALSRDAGSWQRGTAEKTNGATLLDKLEPADRIHRSRVSGEQPPSDSSSTPGVIFQIGQRPLSDTKPPGVPVRAETGVRLTEARCMHAGTRVRGCVNVYKVYLRTVTGVGWANGCGGGEHSADQADGHGLVVHGACRHYLRRGHGGHALKNLLLCGMVLLTDRLFAAMLSAPEHT